MGCWAAALSIVFLLQSQGRSVPWSLPPPDLTRCIPFIVGEEQQGLAESASSEGYHGAPLDWATCWWTFSQCSTRRQRWSSGVLLQCGLFSRAFSCSFLLFPLMFERMFMNILNKMRNTPTCCSERAGSVLRLFEVSGALCSVQGRIPQSGVFILSKWEQEVWDALTKLTLAETSLKHCWIPQ